MSDLNPKDELEPQDTAPSGGEESNGGESDVYLQTIEELRKERDEYYDLLLRKQAEFENYRKRVTRDKEENRLAAVISVLQQILPVIDSCEKGLLSLQESTQTTELQAYRDGYQLLLKQLNAILDKFDVKEIPGAGELFDPNCHEAVSSEMNTQHQDGIILEEYRKGYRIGDRLLRASQVKVAVQPQEISNLEGEA